MTRAVTLLTGDRVVLTTAGGRTSVSVRPAPGRSGVAFTQTEGPDGRLRVLPADALALVASGRVDERLFDVTGLVRAGYDDARSRDLPLIVSYAGSARDRTAARTDLTASGARVTRPLASIGGAAVRTPKADVADVWSALTHRSGAAPDDTATALDAGVARIWLDGPVRASLDQSVPQVGAPAAWQAGFTGDGVRVGLLDSGIDATHPDLDDVVVEAQDFTGSDDPVDRYGHGTHVASIITGDGAASDGRYKGVAPDADLLVGKVLDDGGGGQESWAIAGMEWAVGAGARIVSLSLGACATDGTDPMSQAVDSLAAKDGTLFVVAAGNHPNNPFCTFDERVSTPAVADRALAVGSVDKSDRFSDFSNVGPRLGDGAVKPELTAPGQSIVAARAEGTDLGEPVGERYARLSGTSMATPHVTGAAAILLQQHPEWDADQLRSSLMASAVPGGGVSVFQQGAGRIDIARAIRQPVLPAPAALSMGTARWPHGDDVPVTRRLTYRNQTGTPLTLDLAVATLGPDGKPAPDGVIALSTRRLTVPRFGSAAVDVTTRTDLDVPDGLYSGWVMATRGGDVVARTPVGVDKEVESHDLTLEAVDRDGKAALTQVNLTVPATGVIRTVDLQGPAVTLRLPRARYDLTAPIYSGDPEQPKDLTLVARPDLVLDKDVRLVLDARKGRLIRAVVDSTTADPSLRRAAVSNGALQTGVGTDIDTFRLYATPTNTVTAYPYDFFHQTALAEPLVLTTASPSSRGPGAGAATTPAATLPRGYNLYLSTQDRIPDPTFRVRDSDLGTVKTALHSHAGPESGQSTMVSFPWARGKDLSWGQGYDVTLPGRRLDLYSGGGGLRWANELRMEGGTEYDTFGTFLRSYPPGRTVQRAWNAAPVGPVARPHFAFDRLWTGLSPFSPSAPQHTFSPDSEGTAHTELWKNGELVGTSDDLGGGFYALPAEQATYEVRTRATRDVAWSVLGTRITGRWKVTAGPDADGALPFPNLWISGAVDLLDRAPADTAFPLRLQVRNVDGGTPDLQSVRLAASFDDGQTWKDLPVTAAGVDFRAVVPPAPGASFVSLRARVRGADGTELDQTVIRAYRLRR